MAIHVPTYCIQTFKTAACTSSTTPFALSVTEPGSYTVTVGVVGNCTGESSAYKFAPTPAPQASFSAPEKACLQQAVSFENTSTGAADQQMHYLWKFGDGTSTTEQHPQHTYSGAAGTTYEVSLEVSYGSSLSCTTVHKQNITVVAAEEVSLEASATEFCTGEAVQPQVVGNMLDVQWSDGQQGTSNKQGGTLQANITTAAGCTLSKTIELLRRPLPVLALTAERKQVNRGESVSLSVSVSNNFSVGIPKIFVPQADGAWVITRMEEYPDFSLQLVNSLGQAVLEASPYLNNWDGTQQGRPQPAGVYYYIFKDPAKKVVRTGSITLLR